jgi:tetratricopeptide (TPR) repeat protein
VRQGLLLAVVSDPQSARPALAALRDVAASTGDRATGARLWLLEGQAIHRSGRLSEALAAYDAAARGLSAAGLVDEAIAASVARVDALATVGRVEEAIRLAERLRRSISRRKPSTASASLAINRGNALRLRGDVDAAAVAYDEAVREAARAGNAYLGAVARFNGGIALVEAGDPRSASRRLADAAAWLGSHGYADLAREARANLAWVDAHEGRLGSAIRALDALAGEHRAAGLSRREGVCRLDLADALRRAGDADSAEREALRAAAAFDGAGARAERAEALWLAAASSAASGTSVGRSRAASHLSAARREAKASGRPSVLVRCDVLLADLAARSAREGVRRSHAPAPRELASLAKRASALGQHAVAAEANLVAAASRLDRGSAADVAAARRLFEDVLRGATGRPWARVAAETGIAQSDAATPGRLTNAITRLRRVARFLDGVRVQLPGAWLRAQFVAERLDPLVARVELLLRRDRESDRKEAAALLDAIAARRFLGARPPSGSGRRLQRIRARLESIYDRLARAEGPTRGAEPEFSAEAALERRARAWERAIAEEWRRRERREGDSGTVHAVETAHGPLLFDRTDVPIATPLPSGAAVVHLWRNGLRLRALVRVGDHVGPGVDLGSIEALEGLTLSLRIRAHRWAFLRRSDPAATDPRAIERVLRELADLLLPGLDVDRWPQDVRIAADPTLPDVPWEMLPCCGGRLGEGYRVLRVPAGASWGRPRRSGEGMVVLGVGAPDLPGVSRELHAIAAAAGVNGDARVLSGAEATRAAAAEALATAKVVHVAGHGWDAEQAPPLGGVRLADGWFTAADLPPGGVSADLVILAACRTGRAAGRAALAWGGLVPALLSAGARRVLWTIDDVDDSATARLMTLFHEARTVSDDDRTAFGQAAAKAAVEAGHVGAVLAFRLSGVVP